MGSEERRTMLLDVLESYRAREREALAELRLFRQKITEVEAELSTLRPTRDDDPVPDESGNGIDDLASKSSNPVEEG